MLIAETTDSTVCYVFKEYNNHCISQNSDCVHLTGWKPQLSMSYFDKTDQWI